MGKYPILPYLFLCRSLAISKQVLFEPWMYQYTALESFICVDLKCMFFLVHVIKGIAKNSSFADIQTHGFVDQQNSHKITAFWI